MQNENNSQNNTGNIHLERLDLQLPGDKFDKVIADLSKTIEQDPEDAKAYFCRGMVYSNMVNYGKLVQAFNKGLAELDARTANAHDDQSAVQLLDSYCDKAIQDCTKALELGLVHAVVYECRGRMYLQKSECDKAMAKYAEAAAFDPEYAMAYDGPPLGPFPASTLGPVPAPVPGGPI